MGKTTNKFQAVIRDNNLNDNHRAGHSRSRRESGDRTTTGRAAERPERNPTGHERATTGDGPSGTYCTAPSVNVETVIAARRPTRAQGRPSNVKEDQEEPLRLCQFYMRTGTCGYGDSCRHIHPPNVQPPTLSAVGYPLREGVERCRFYMRNGFCGYGATCRFNHPTTTDQRTGETLPPSVFGPTMNGGAPFSEPMYVPQMPASSWYGPMFPPVSYAAYITRQQSFPFVGGYHHYSCCEYPPLPLPMSESWTPSGYLAGSPPLGLQGPTNSDGPCEFHEDVSKLEFDDDSDTSDHIDRCWSN